MVTLSTTKCNEVEHSAIGFKLLFETCFLIEGYANLHLDLFIVFAIFFNRRKQTGRSPFKKKRTTRVTFNDSPF